MSDHMHGNDNIPQAHSVRVFFCAGPECRRPHVLLFDAFGKTIAQFVCPDGFGEKLMEAQWHGERLRGEREPLDEW